MKKKMLFVCIHNSARSQMAEELLRKLAGDRFETESAGIEPGKLNPLVVEVLQEVGINIAGKQPQSAQSLIDQKKHYDYVVTVCDEASAERCPVFPGKHKRLHWGFPDPSRFEGTRKDKLAKTREVRDAIRSKIESWLKEQD